MQKIKSNEINLSNLEFNLALSKANESGIEISEYDFQTIQYCYSGYYKVLYLNNDVVIKFDDFYYIKKEISTNDNDTDFKYSVVKN
jgi:regulation of enolase protein 1 (concanavalin A-like superfamily)